MGKFATSAQTAAAVIQSTAIVLAGAWAVYEFILKEQAKSLHVVPSIEVKVVGQEPKEPSVAGISGDVERNFLPVEIEVIVDNSSDKEAYVIAGYVSVWAHKSRNEEIDIADVELYGTPGRGLLDSRFVIWNHELALVGHAVSFASKIVAPRENNSEKIVFLVPARTYDILEAQASFYVVDACTGFYPFETCHSFTSVFSWDVKESCENPDEFHGNDYCVDFYTRLDEGEEWLPVPIEELESKFGAGNFTTTEMIVLPGAPILTSDPVSAPTAAD